MHKFATLKGYPIFFFDTTKEVITFTPDSGFSIVAANTVEGLLSLPHMFPIIVGSFEITSPQIALADHHNRLIIAYYESEDLELYFYVFENRLYDLSTGNVYQVDSYVFNCNELVIADSDAIMWAID